MDNSQQLKDPVFEAVRQISEKDGKISERAVAKFVEVLKTLFDNDEEFTTKHGFIALGRAIVYLSQTFCKDNEHFEIEVEKAENLAVEKMLPSIMPVMQDGKIIGDFDAEDTSVRRVIMALGTAIDYTIWRNELSQYAEMRAKLEGQVSNEDSSQEAISETQIEKADEVAE
jgi:hypothetical protein